MDLPYPSTWIVAHPPPQYRFCSAGSLRMYGYQLGGFSAERDASCPGTLVG
jgi:hypothetical protein